ncbi:MAG: ABC transporter substrate-binding protein [Candidatus Dormibacteria bacterium]
MPTPPKPSRQRRLRLLSGALGVALAAAACAPASAVPSLPALRVGAIFPLSGSTAADARDEYVGASLAAQLVNQAGGIRGRHISLDLRDVDSTAQIDSAVAGLRRDGVSLVMGAYASQLSIPAAAAVARAGMVYWETGAVADQVTGQGSPLVFRVGANGADLGGNSGRFVVQQLAPRLGAQIMAAGAFLVTANDAYAHSVANGARAALLAGGVAVSGEAVYDPFAPDWGPVIAQLRAAHPSILLLSSHVPDGVAFRLAFLAAGLQVQAFIGTTMAQCTDFGAALGADAVGVFASDRPDYGFNVDALSGPARALFQRFAAAWSRVRGGTPTEEAISGFSAAWALFDQVLPRAARLDASAIAAAARSLDLATGSLPNGAGVRFSSAADDMGQNLRAAADIWQWQAPRHYVVVWPATYATGSTELFALAAPATPSEAPSASPAPSGW